MKLSTRAFWNAATTLVAEGLAIVLQFWLVRFLFDRLGADYGLATLVASFILYLLMVDMGVRRALTRQLAASIASGDRERSNQFFSTAIVSLMALAAVLVAACVVGAPWIIRLARVAPQDFKVAVALTRWYVSPMIVLSLISPLYKSVLIALNRFDVVNYIRLAEVGVRFTTIVALLSLTNAGLWGWALGMAGGLTTEFVLAVIAARRLAPHLRFSPRDFHYGSLGELWWLGLSSVVYENGRTLAISTHPMVIARFLGKGANVAYDPARQVAMAIDLLVSTVTRQILPLTAGFHATGKSERLRELLVRGTRFTLILGGPGCVLLSIFAEPLLRHWMPASFVQHLPAATAALSFWCAISLVKFVGGTQYQVLFGMERVWMVSIVELVQSLLALLASVVLTAWLAGWLGEVALIGVMIPTLGFSLVARAINTVQVSQVVDVTLAEYVRVAYWPPLRALGCLLVAAWGVSALIPPATLWRFVLSGGLAGLLSVPLIWWLAMDERDHGLILGLARRRRPEPVEPLAADIAAGTPEAVDA